MNSDHQRLYNNSFSYSNPRSRLLLSYIFMATRLNRNSTTSNGRFPILSRSYLPLALTDSSPFLETNVGHLNSNPLRIPALIHSQKSKYLVVYPTVYRFRILGDRIVPHLWFVAYTTASPACSTLICPSLSILHHLLHMVMFMNTEVNFLVQLRHPNLVKLIGYCYEDNHRLLVYEFMF
ncbi:unnamed protein product [Lactuca saligna]|uniref:Serine-threonine/tyrosine-protein kinase catalytic domain-containing protein n=1 Tax=Lactuca saligna TaxID=75948 RepID=A0AA35ZVF6_LACSI|nr:unnamed protein product [Lactuca saligna]